MNLLPLFKNFPQLHKKLPYVSLGQFPTPVEKINIIENLFIKRDDLSAIPYGGNKVRKLEFLLGYALSLNSKRIITLGFAGSNHALATAIYADKLGFKSTSMLLPQINAFYVRQNLLTSFYYNAELCHYNNFLSLLTGIVIKKIIKSYYFIPAGGSCPLGVLGYINALFELKEQILKGEMPEPEYIYLPLGSAGTSIGLAIGAKAIGLASKIVAVRVIEKKLTSLKDIIKLGNKTLSFIRKIDPLFPDFKFSMDNYTIRDEFLGNGYAHFTEDGVKAANLLKQKYNIVLNGAYSAKAFAAMLSDIEKGNLKNKTVLFWNTYNSRDISQKASSIDYRNLPKPFHRYFEGDVQSLDNPTDAMRY